MPYIFATGHFKYTRYGLSYINSMEKWNETLKSFMKGERSTCHKSGI